jgi:DNA-directed RNA polymerase specialized sigma24 family protein
MTYPSNTLGCFTAWQQSGSDEDYSQFVLSLMPFCISILKSRDEDLLQEVFMQLFKKMKKYNPGVATYYTYAKQQCKAAKKRWGSQQGAVKVWNVKDRGQDVNFEDVGLEAPDYYAAEKDAELDLLDAANTGWKPPKIKARTRVARSK